MNDDLDEEIIGTDQGFDDFAQKNTLGDMWRNNPLVKVGIVIVGVALIAGVAMFFGSSDEKTAQSVMMGGSSNVSTTPGATEGATPAYIQAVEAQNEEDLEKALQTGSSTLPVPVESPTDRLIVPEEEEQITEDPLMRWRRLQEERLSRDIENQAEIEPVTVLDSEAQSEAMKKLAEAMSSQMQSILGNKGQTATFHYTQVRKEQPDVDEDGVPDTQDPNDNNNGQDPGFEELDSQGIEEEVAEEILIPAGEIEYAQLITEANSDIPGPVLAMLVSGPLAGSKLLGSFSVVDEYLSLNFETIVVDEVSYDITAIALDPATTLPGMATEVDHRYFKRIVLPAAAAFVEGFADAMAQTEQTQITIDTGGTTTSATDADADTEQEVANGISEAGQEVRDILEDIADETEILVKIHAGTPIGVLFTEPVIQEEES